MRLVVPFPPGGTADLLGRLVAQRLGDALKTTVVIDNRVGAGGSVGAEVVAKAPPDGTTLLLGNASTHAINQWLYKRIGYDPIKDFAPIAQVANVPLIMLVHPSLPVKSAKDLVALARKRPGQMNYASGGAGSTTHLSMELLKTLLKLDIAHIAYRGSGPALSALMAGEIPVMIERMYPPSPRRSARATRLPRGSALSHRPAPRLRRSAGSMPRSSSSWLQPRYATGCSPSVRSPPPDRRTIF
jgi:tripartite-type tricarboxylate transporter receptor subunit TctC